MKQSMIKILTAMMQNAKMSDREISSKVGVSQPTVSRTRAMLVRKGIIKGYAVIPDLKKLGYEIIMISQIERRNALTKLDAVTETTLTNKLLTDPRVIFAMQNPRDIWVISIHKNFSDFSNFSMKYNTVTNHYATTDSGILKDPAVTSP